MRKRRRSVSFTDEMIDMIPKAIETAAKNLNGLHLPEAHILSEAMRLGLIQLVTGVGNVVQSGADGIKEKNQKKDIYTDRSITEDSTSQKIDAEIERLRQRYDNLELIDRTFEAIKSTRVSGKIGPTIILGALRKWATCPVEAVYMACERYLDKGFAAQGKKENYLWGMVKGCEDELIRPIQPSKASQPSGRAGEPEEWRDFRRNHFYCEQTGDWAPRLINGKPDYGAPRVSPPKGMLTPESKPRPWNPRSND
jgi:hypothetical protein